jgi:GxxExxY protein
VPAEILDQFVRQGPLLLEELEAAVRRFKKAIIERALGTLPGVSGPHCRRAVASRQSHGEQELRTDPSRHAAISARRSVIGVRISPVFVRHSLCSSALLMLIDNEHLNSVTGSILSAAIEVHRVLGPGLLESIYSACTQYELAARGLRFVCQHPIPIVYKDVRLESIYRVDLIVEDLVVVEIKSVDVITPVHKAQVLTYLRLAKCPAGLLVNFNAPRLMDGVKRLINSMTDARARQP